VLDDGLFGHAAQAAAQQQTDIHLTDVLFFKKCGDALKIRVMQADAFDGSSSPWCG